MRYYGTVWCGLCDDEMYYDRKNDLYICKGCLSFFRKNHSGINCWCSENEEEMFKGKKTKNGTKVNYYDCLNCKRKVFLHYSFSGKFRDLFKSSKDKRWNQYIKEQDTCRSYCIKKDLRVLDSEFR